MKNIFKILFVSCILSILLNNRSYAQQEHFLYIQADDKQVFNVNVNGKTYNSSDIGYVIIPKLTDGKYQLNINFPDNKYPAQQFSCVINKNDAGYELKNFNEKGWGLFNLQTLNVTMAGEDVPDIPKDTTNPNAFGEMLSDVMRDTSLKKAGIELQKEEQQKEIEAENAKNNPPTVVVVPTLNDSLLNAQRQDSNSVAKSIMKISERKTSTGTHMVFVDASTGDTIKVFLPKAEQAIAQQQNTENKKAPDTTVAQDLTVTSEPNVQDSTNRSKPSVDSNAVAQSSPANSNANENKQPEQETENENLNPTTEAPVNNNNQPNNPFYKGEKKTDSTNTAATTNNEPPSTNTDSSSSPAFKQDCQKMVSDNELEKLKKKMVSSNTNDKMIQTAKKFIEDKCVTTDQVKSLGLLFLTDDGRYSFFDAMYKNVYDISAFSSLQSQLIDPYYKKRFQAMLK